MGFKTLVFCTIHQTQRTALGYTIEVNTKVPISKKPNNSVTVSPLTPYIWRGL